MRYRLICIMLLFLVVFSSVSCRNLADEEVIFYKELDSSLIRSNEAVYRATGMAVRDIESKMVDPNIALTEKAKKWYPKVETILNATDQVYKFINDLKMELNRTEGKKVLTEARITQLLAKLAECKNRLLNIDPDLTSAVGASIPLHSSTNTKLKNTSLTVAHTALSKLQSDIRQTAFMMIAYCNSKMGTTGDPYDKYILIVHGNAARYYQGETAEIYAGLFLTKDEISRDVIINGKKAERTPNGDFRVKFNVGNEVAVYSTTVQINYIDPNTGKASTIKKMIQYEVEKKRPHYLDE